MAKNRKDFERELNRALTDFKPADPDRVRKIVERMHTFIGRDDVSLRAVEMADGCASGHVDYFNKFALYCYELYSHGGIAAKWQAERAGLRPNDCPPSATTSSS